MGRTLPPPVPPAALARRISPDESGRVLKAQPKPLTPDIPGPPPIPREAMRPPALRVIRAEAEAQPENPPTLPTTPPEALQGPLAKTLPKAALPKAALPPRAKLPPASIPPKLVLPTPPIPSATLPPPDRPRIEDDDDFCGEHTVEERLQDTFERTLASLPAPAPSTPWLTKVSSIYQAMSADVLGRVDDALLAAVEERIVTPLYYIGGVVAVRTLLVPALLLFLAGVALGASSEDVRKTFPKTSPATAVAAVNATVADREALAPAQPSSSPEAAVAEAAVADPEPQTAESLVRPSGPAQEPAVRRPATDRRSTHRARRRARRARARRAARRARRRARARR